LCQTFYTLIEYGKTTMFLWMFIEGIILYHMTTVAYSRGPENQLFFYLCGWCKFILKILLISFELADSKKYRCLACYAEIQD
jgi:hypothetical protein